MMFINESDVMFIQRETERRGHERSLHGAAILARLIDWTNDNSDGWAYWQAPSRAANKLSDLLHFRYLTNLGKRIEGDVTEAELKKALTPIKAFLTRRGVEPDVRRYILGRSA